jgi:hypothetical protein
MEGFIVPAPPAIVNVPIGWPMLAQRNVPSGTLTVLALTLIVTQPPHAVSRGLRRWRSGRSMWRARR